MSVPVNFETHTQFQWWAARKLFTLHQADKLGAHAAWRHISIEERQGWRIVALLGIYSGWSTL